MDKPSYFRQVRDSAAQRWDQLEGDPELAGPWHQLFKGVKSPRYVLSELLQNADDVGATEATADVVNGKFVFSHNGADFDEDQFASLCKFGFSNKRNLHTIGFRGVGFKSTFSLGDEVHLNSPTLSVAFHEKRFTLPLWRPTSHSEPSVTTVRVSIKSDDVEKLLRQNLKEWSESPASLLFFRSLRRLRVCGQTIEWESRGCGPVEGSHWMSLSSEPGDQFLLIRSPEEKFPGDSMEEILSERMADSDGASFPPCRVEIVLGFEGGLFAVLPTGVSTGLPFACNAPFIQDPTRDRIKDPATSPTNQWLLKRVGELASSSLLAWVGRKSLEIEDRCEAYSLFPGTGSRESSIGSVCKLIVQESFESTIQGESFLLTEDDYLKPSATCLAVPKQLLDVWSPSQISSIFVRGRLDVLSQSIKSNYVEKLEEAGHVETLSRVRISSRLESDHLPRPENWRKLANLWNYAISEFRTSWILNSDGLKRLKIVPVHGKLELHAASEVVRLEGARRLDPSDLEFMAPFLPVLDPKWTDFLSPQKTGQDPGAASHPEVVLARQALGTLDLARPTSADRIMRIVTDSFFAPENEHSIEDYVRMAHVAARLRASVPTSFQYITKDALVREPRSDVVLADVSGNLAMFVHADWYQELALHDDYLDFSDTCTTVNEWTEWVASSNNGIQAFVPIARDYTWAYSRARLQTLLQQRGYNGEFTFPYTSDNFRIDDWDFPKKYWDYWNHMAKEDEAFWIALLKEILSQPESYWSGKSSAVARHIARNGYERQITNKPLCPGWIQRLRNLPCLPDTYGQPKKPSELLRRTRETESLMGAASFVHPDYDNVDTQPILRLLGVGDKPNGPEVLLERIRALSVSNVPLVAEVQKWCYSLDQIFDACSTDEIHQIKAAFAEGRLILTEQDSWAKADEVFLNSNDYDVPGAVLVHSLLSDLAIWRKVGVAERPSLEMEIEWLKTLQSGKKLDTDQSRRVLSLLAANPRRIWDECGHWVSLDRTWMDVKDLDYSLTMQSLVAWNHLFPRFKERTADFQMLASELCDSAPFSMLPTLGEIIAERPDELLFGSRNSQTRDWIVALGRGMGRIAVDDPEQGLMIREVATRLAQTNLQVVDGLRTTPYIEGVAAGTSRPREALWLDVTLYVRNGHPARMASNVPQEIGRAFAYGQISEAIKMCYERGPAFIEAYLEENFNLVSEEEISALDKVASCTAKSGSVVGEDVEAEVGEFAGRQELDWDDSEESTEPSGSDDGFLREWRRNRRYFGPGLMERFARLSGFTNSTNVGFTNAEGGRIAKTQGEVFPWAQYSPTGDTVRFYWDRSHCLHQEALQLGADIWILCEQNPDLYSLILTDTQGIPIEIRGHDLVRMRDHEQLTLHPAAYRLVYEGNGH